MLGYQFEAGRGREFRVPYLKQPHHDGIHGGELCAQTVRLCRVRSAVAPRREAGAGAFQDT